ncbi:MAG: tetratricopeptide repeat protein [Syntrophales bacterium]|nr:tetratricopeptide repeat protein [Syntrophales bacterium]
MLFNLSEASRRYLICFFLVFITIAVYGQVKDYDFINLDDKQYILDNSHVLSGLTVENVKWAFTSVYASNWHPLTWLSHMLDCDLFGINAGRFHAVNVFFHLASTLLLFLILNRATRAPWRSAFVAALFAIHPLHVESVAWIAERKDVLCGFFWMLTLGAYILYVEKKQPYKYLLALFFFALGLMCKPMLVTIPFVMLLLDFWPLNRLKVHEPTLRKRAGPDAKVTIKDKGRKKEKIESEVKAPVAEVHIGVMPLPWSRLIFLIREKIPFFALSAISSIITVYAQHQGGAIASMEGMSLSARTANALMSYVLYIEKTLWPQNLAIFYPYPGAWSIWLVAGAFMLLAGITVVVVYAVKRYPYLAVGWFWYLGTLVPVIGILQVGMQAMADRYTYLPMIGLLILGTWGIRDAVMKWISNETGLVIVASLALLSLAGLSWFQIQSWQNSVTLFKHALAVTKDNYLAHNNLGVALNAAGDAKGALFHYSEAIRLRPQDSNAHYNYANYLKAHNRIEEAIAHYTEAIRLEPGYFNAYNNLGVALASRGSFKEAAFQYRQALRIRPDASGVRYNLAVVLANLGDRGEAEHQLREAIRMEPNFAEAHNDLGMMLAMQGKTEEGILQFREALRLKPKYTEANHNLSLALEYQRRKR